MKKNGFLQLVFGLIAFWLVSPAMAQNENVVTLAGNAYITSGHTAFIDEGHNAIRNWSDKETLVSFYFRAQESGQMKIALQARGKSQIEVSLLGKKKIVTLNSDALSRVELARSRSRSLDMSGWMYVV